jgi:hypothetical protein
MTQTAAGDCGGYFSFKTFKAIPAINHIMPVAVGEDETSR